MAPVLAVARRSGRNRWRSNLVLSLLVALTVAVAVSTLVGARRSESAFDRLRAESHSSDLQLFLDEPDLAAAVEELEGIDGISEVGVSSLLFVRPVGSELIPDYQLLATAARTDLAPGELDQPRIVAGRALQPEAVDEVVISEELAREVDVEVGDRIELESMTDAWVDVAFSGGDPGPPDGPVVPVQVVGLARTPADFGRFAGHILHLSPAFAGRYEDQVRTYTWVSVNVDDPSEASMRALVDGPLAGVDIDEAGFSYFADSDATQDGLATIATALRLVAAAGVLAGLTAVGLALARLARDELAVRATLAAMGWTRVQLALLVALVFGPWVVVGVLAGLVLGTLSSTVSVVGLARAVDPDVDALSAHVGWILLVGLAALAVLGPLVGFVSWRAARVSPGVEASGRSLPRLTRPLALPIGVRRALFGSSDRGGRASRTAAAAVVASVTVAVAALVVGTSIQRLEDDPSLSGQGSISQRAIDGGESLDVFEQVMGRLEPDDRIATLLGIHVAFGVRGSDGDEITGLVVDVRRGDLDAPVVSGRFVVQPDEVAFGPKTLDELDLSVGDEIELGYEETTARFRIVGTTLFPEGDFEHDSGLAMTVGGAERLLGGIEATAIHQVAFEWADGVDPEVADRELTDQGMQVFTTDEGLQPPAVSNLAEVGDLPLLLAALVLVLGLATLLHAVLLTTRLRDREAGTLRALGVTPKAVATVVETQAAVLGLLAAAAGLPLGFALGRQVWSPIAERAHVVDVAVTPWAGSVWVSAAVLACAVVLTMPIAVRAHRQRPAEALRAE